MLDKVIPETQKMKKAVQSQKEVIENISETASVYQKINKYEKLM